MSATPADDPLAAQLAAWRAAGAARTDPVRWRYLEALAVRAGAQDEPMRSLARRKLEAAVAQFADRLQQAQPAPPRTRVADDPACKPLAGLNAYLREAVASRQQDDTTGPLAPPGELASVRAFRKAWTRGRAQEQVAQALARKPANAGPLNSHALVLQALASLRALSPDYLRRLLVQVETLQWLDQAVATLPAKEGKAGKPGKDPKPAARKGRAKKA